MSLERKALRVCRTGSPWLLGALLALSACAKEPTPVEEVPASHPTRIEASGGASSGLRELPAVEAGPVISVFAQKLERPTPLGETTAVHVKLPPPSNRELAESLVRVVGDPRAPMVLFRSDTLARLGAIPTSPGPDFFTLFSHLPDSELLRRVGSETRVARGEFGAVTRETLLFNGRHPSARFMGLPADARSFRDGSLTPLSYCPQVPVSTQAGWERTLLVRDPAVVLDSARTWDPCTGAGTKGGRWTFAHLMRQMAMGSGASPEAFVTQWLSSWLNDFTLNGDTVPARRKMYDEVIAPWATASGAQSSLLQNASTGRWEVQLNKPLDLGIAPFRLLAIVNRLDLGNTQGGGYGRQANAGELRFVFGLTRPSPWGSGGTEATCNLKPFTVIFEYGVPGTGCATVVAWARQWAMLGNHPSFDAAYRAQLTAMTESVVLYGMAAGKGNLSALNQLRTNEAVLGATQGRPWELREFRLTDENPANGTDTPAHGFLRPHTLSLTPDDAAHDSQMDDDVDLFVRTQVKGGLELPVVIPNRCTAKYAVPYRFKGRSFQGANALVAPPTHWAAHGASATDASEVCARKAFSLNTCNGCHFKDTGTNDFSGVNNTAFTHISPTSGIPARLSRFLTGGGPGLMFSVPDAQFGAAVTSWSFADLQRRHELLYDVATCSLCGRFRGLDAGFLERMEELTGAVPLDVSPGAQAPPFKVGPIRDVEMVTRLLELRPAFKEDFWDAPLSFLRPPEVFVH
ncbi:hypothetical protein D7Y13_20445 [Corallococcus praedator]|uniref:Lipoprotein n=1 Tax=Corallococcus praedator TaxID=2316724 RepID=A0ABX9QG72_9BACT|nr:MULTISPECIES: hypothetical protein [Corallococcus]RKH26543.1 hypothetical protein D7X75_28095 [Corallococcus sp. CA031C]RKI06300.1 hypothetical protein D7Y13_20445 [Corallococcus praedator]